MKDKDKEEDTTTKCGSCGKVIYKNEICSCQKKDNEWSS